GDERRGALGGAAVGVDAPREPLGDEVGVAALGRQPEELLEAAPVLRVAGHLAEVAHPRCLSVSSWDRHLACHGFDRLEACPTSKPSHPTRFFNSASTASRYSSVVRCGALSPMSSA